MLSTKDDNKCDAIYKKMMINVMLSAKDSDKCDATYTRNS